MKTKIQLLFLFIALNSYSQNENPYRVFGYEGKVLKTPQERMNYMVLIPVDDSTTVVTNIGIEPNKGKYYLFDKSNRIIHSDTIAKEQLARFFAVDPLAKDYPHNSVYAFSENRVIDSGELEGLERYYVADGTKLGSLGTNTTVMVVNSNYVKQATEMFANKSASPEALTFFVRNTGMSEGELFMRATLTVLKSHEGGVGKESYYKWNKGDKFTEAQAEKGHPGLSPKGKQAAGAFQTQKASWNDTAYGVKVRNKYDIKDFLPISQDRFTVGTIKDKSHKFDEIIAGNFESSLPKLAKEWRCLPSDKSQNKGYTLQDAVNDYNKAISNELKGTTDLATPQGELLKGF